MFVGMAITAMVGRLGAASLTAVGLATMVQFSAAMVFTIIGVWLVRMPLVYLFIRVWHFDITIAWFVTLFDFIVRGIVLKYRFASNKWQRISV